MTLKIYLHASNRVLIAKYEQIMFYKVNYFTVHSFMTDAIVQGTFSLPGFFTFDFKIQNF